MSSTTSRRDTFNPTNANDPLGLLLLYRARPDLQAAFPEVANGDYIRLMDWAKDAISQRDDLVDQLNSVQKELGSIHHSFGYKFMKFYSRSIDQLFPERTSRGEFRKIVTSSLRLMTEEGMKNFARKSLEKIRRREFRIIEGPSDTVSVYKRYWSDGYKSPASEEEDQEQAQPSFLKKQGLKPNDLFLDLGCGYLRGTIRLVDYLEDGMFFGIDISDANIRRARARALELCRHKPNLAVANRFEIEQIWSNMRFDMIFAASVFTHIFPRDIEECLRRVSRVLRGKFYATIFKDNTVPVYGGWCGVCADHMDKSHNCSTAIRQQNLERLNFCYNTEWMMKAARNCGLKMQELGSTEVYQYMVEFSPL
jgi:ubiquinone/menaquinone biosynthesis C-methylase UbiE